MLVLLSLLLSVLMWPLIWLLQMTGSRWAAAPRRLVQGRVDQRRMPAVRLGLMMMAGRKSWCLTGGEGN